MKSFFPFLLLISIFCTSCYQDIEECLDPLAKNYELSADVACKACCLYPDLSIGISHLYGSENYSINKMYVDAVGDTFTIADQAFFFSEIKFNDAESQLINNLTFKQFTIGGETKTFPTDYCLLRSTPVECIAGSAKFAGGLSSLQFLVGLRDDLTRLDSISVATDKNLSRREVLYTSNGYRSAYFSIKTNDGMVKTVFVADDIPISLITNNPPINKPGATIQYKIKLDYAVLFQGIAFKTEGIDAI
ncbi:MAG TPA: hypothetical protein PLZ32_04985, partial [Saprospiraceae bacterium]|nr:hypothetical protein [Saprospiraceae bacterium]